MCVNKLVELGPLVLGPNHWEKLLSQVDVIVHRLAMAKQLVPEIAAQYLPTRASEQGKVISLVSVYIY